MQRDAEISQAIFTNAIAQGEWGRVDATHSWKAVTNNERRPNYTVVHKKGATFIFFDNSGKY